MMYFEIGGHKNKIEDEIKVAETIVWIPELQTSVSKPKYSAAQAADISKSSPSVLRHACDGWSDDPSSNLNSIISEKADYPDVWKNPTAHW